MLDAVELGVLSPFGRNDRNYLAPHAVAQIVLLAEEGHLKIEYVPGSGEIGFTNLTTVSVFQNLTFSQQTIMLFLFGGELTGRKIALTVCGGSSLPWKLRKDLRKHMQATGLLEPSRRGRYIVAACLVGSLALWLGLIIEDAPSDMKAAALLGAICATVVCAVSGLRPSPLRRTLKGKETWKEAIDHLDLLQPASLVVNLVRDHSTTSWDGLEWGRWLCLPPETNQPALVARAAADLLLQIFSAQPGREFTRYGGGSG